MDLGKSRSLVRHRLLRAWNCFSGFVGPLCSFHFYSVLYMGVIVPLGPGTIMWSCSTDRGRKLRAVPGAQARFSFSFRYATGGWQSVYSAGRRNRGPRGFNSFTSFRVKKMANSQTVTLNSWRHPPAFVLCITSTVWMHFFFPPVNPLCMCRQFESHSEKKRSSLRQQQWEVLTVHMH